MTAKAAVGRYGDLLLGETIGLGSNSIFGVVAKVDPGSRKKLIHIREGHFVWYVKPSDLIRIARTPNGGKP